MIKNILIYITTILFTAFMGTTHFLNLRLNEKVLKMKHEQQAKDSTSKLEIPIDTNAIYKRAYDRCKRDFKPEIIVKLNNIHFKDQNISFYSKGDSIYYTIYLPADTNIGKGLAGKSIIRVR